MMWQLLPMPLYPQRRPGTTRHSSHAALSGRTCTNCLPVLEQDASPLHESSSAGLVTGRSMGALHVQHAADSWFQGPAATHGSPGLIAQFLAWDSDLCQNAACIDCTPAHERCMPPVEVSNR